MEMLGVGACGLRVVLVLKEEEGGRLHLHVELLLPVGQKQFAKQCEGLSSNQPVGLGAFGRQLCRCRE